MLRYVFYSFVLNSLFPNRDITVRINAENAVIIKNARYPIESIIAPIIGGPIEIPMQETALTIDAKVPVFMTFLVFIGKSITTIAVTPLISAVYSAINANDSARLKP